MKKILIIGGAIAALGVIGFAAFLVWVYIDARDVPSGPGSEQFQQASSLIDPGNELAAGNSPKAKELADRMRNIMESMRKEYFSDPSSYPVSVYCQLIDDRCAFLICMPGIYRYDATSKQKLAEMAWVSVQPILRHVPQKPQDLAIGLRGGIPYDVVWTGRVVDNPLQDPDNKYTGTNCRVKLYPYFTDN